MAGAKLSMTLFRRSLLPWYLVGCAVLASTFPVFWMSSSMLPHGQPTNSDDPLTSLMKSSSSFDIVLYQFKHGQSFNQQDHSNNLSSFTRDGQFKAVSRKQRNTVVFFGHEAENESRDEDSNDEEEEDDDDEKSGDNKDDDHHNHQRRRQRNRRRPSKSHTQLRHQRRQKHEDIHDHDDQENRRQRRDGRHHPHSTRFSLSSSSSSSRIRIDNQLSEIQKVDPRLGPIGGGDPLLEKEKEKEKKKQKKKKQQQKQLLESKKKKGEDEKDSEDDEDDDEEGDSEDDDEDEGVIFSWEPEYGTIRYHPAEVIQNQHHKSLWARRIRHQGEDEMIAKEEREYLLRQLDKRDNRDDDEYYYHDEELVDFVGSTENDGCYRPNWRSRFYPVCNAFHERSISSQLTNVGGDGVGSVGSDVSPVASSSGSTTMKYLGHGSWRDAWKLEENNVDGRNTTGSIVMKIGREHRDVETKVLANIAKEAIILERLTASPRIVDIFGYCGISEYVESMSSEVEDEIMVSSLWGHPDKTHKLIAEKKNDIENRRTQQQEPQESPKPEWISFNNLTSEERVNVAIEMVETIAAIHGFEGGVIVNGDLHTEQFLRNDAGQLKLNDFNNAVLMEWSFDKEHYCQVEHEFTGTFHAREEHEGYKQVDERIDVFSIGSSIFTLLAGLWPHWEYDADHDAKMERIENGIIPALDFCFSLSKNKLQDHPIEERLIQIMEPCLAGKKEDRPSIFEVLDQLNKLKKDISSGDVKNLNKTTTTDTNNKTNTARKTTKKTKTTKAVKTSAR